MRIVRMMMRRPLLWLVLVLGGVGVLAYGDRKTDRLLSLAEKLLEGGDPDGAVLMRVRRLLVILMMTPLGTFSRKPTRRDKILACSTCCLTISLLVILRRSNWEQCCRRRNPIRD